MSHYFYSDSRKVYFSSIEQLLGSKIGICPNLRVGKPFNRNRCVISIYTGVFLSIGFRWYAGYRELFAVLHPCRIENDLFDSFSLIHFVCVQSIFNNCLFSPVESFRVYLLMNGLWGENIETVVFRCGVNSAGSFSLELFHRSYFIIEGTCIETRFMPKPTGVSSCPSMNFYLWASVRI